MFTKISTVSQLFTVTDTKSQVPISFQSAEYAWTLDFPAIKNETGTSGIPEAGGHRLI